MNDLAIIQTNFELACKKASSMQIADNFGAAFQAVVVVKSLRDILTDEIMKEVFMPLMNTKVGFLTDRTGKPGKDGKVAALYSISEVRDAIIDGVSIGLLPTGNQMNIIAGNMYPTKEGYTALLKRLGVKYILSTGVDRNTNQEYAEIPVTIDYEYDGQRKKLVVLAIAKKGAYSSMDQLRGKAERKAKRALYEYITGTDFGEVDDVITPHDEVSSTVKTPIQPQAPTANDPKQGAGF